MAESEEKWITIPEYEGLYQVSNFGRVKSMCRIIQKGERNYFLKEKILKGTKDAHGYIVVGLYKKQKPKNFKIHVLVAMAFLNHRPNGLRNVVHHMDHNKENNSIKNLEIVSHRKNASMGNGKKRASNHLGVYRSSDNKKWCSRITIENKRVFLGRFDTEKEAAKAYSNKLNTIKVG